MKNQCPTIVNDDETPSTSANVNPNVPTNAIIFKKRPGDETNLSRPENKWQKYSLDDVNEHHLSETANHRALNEFFRTRPQVEEKLEDFVQRPMKKEILNEQDEDELQPRQISISAPKQTKSSSNDDDIHSFKLSKQKKTRGVFSTNKKSIIKEQIDDQSDDDDDEPNEDEDQDEFFEP